MEHTERVWRRNYGIDLLRIVAMFYVIILHILGIGGLQGAAEASAQKLLCNAFSMWCYCAVNIFGIITGYVGYSDTAKPLKFKNYLRIWVQMVFYNLVLTLLTLWLYPGRAQLSSIATSFLPLISNKHWYFTAYTGVFFLIPFLNAAVRSCEKRQLLMLLALIVFVFCPIEVYFRVFVCNDGYSMIWLIILYIVGAILRKTQLIYKIQPLAAFAGIVAVQLVSLLICSLSAWWCYPIPDGDIRITSSYVYPGHLLVACLYLSLFAQWKPGRFLQKFAAFAAPGAFAVSIINSQRFVLYGYMYQHFAPWASCSPVEIAVRVVMTAAVFTLVSLVIDWLRRQLFRPLGL